MQDGDTGSPKWKCFHEFVQNSRTLPSCTPCIWDRYFYILLMIEHVSSFQCHINSTSWFQNELRFEKMVHLIMYVLMYYIYKLIFPNSMENSVLVTLLVTAVIDYYTLQIISLQCTFLEIKSPLCLKDK